MMSGISEKKDDYDEDDKSSVLTGEFDSEIFSEDGFEAFDNLKKKINKNDLTKFMTPVLSKKKISELIEKKLNDYFRDFTNFFTEFGSLPSFAKKDILNHKLYNLVCVLDSICDRIILNKPNIADKDISIKYIEVLTEIIAITKTYNSF